MFDKLFLTACAAVFAAIEPVSLAIRISLNVFHWPQLGHFPIHFVDSCPQLLHTYAILSLAISMSTSCYISHKSNNKFYSSKIICYFCMV